MFQHLWTANALIFPLFLFLKTVLCAISRADHDCQSFNASIHAGELCRCSQKSEPAGVFHSAFFFWQFNGSRLKMWSRTLFFIFTLYKFRSLVVLTAHTMQRPRRNRTELKSCFSINLDRCKHEHLMQLTNCTAYVKQVKDKSCFYKLHNVFACALSRVSNWRKKDESQQ